MYNIKEKRQGGSPSGRIVKNKCVSVTKNFRSASAPYLCIYIHLYCCIYVYMCLCIYVYVFLSTSFCFFQPSDNRMHKTTIAGVKYIFSLRFHPPNNFVLFVIWARGQITLPEIYTN
jgi:hypothetical protein